MTNFFLIFTIETFGRRIETFGRRGSLRIASEYMELINRLNTKLDIIVMARITKGLPILTLFDRLTVHNFSKIGSINQTQTSSVLIKVYYFLNSIAAGILNGSPENCHCRTWRVNTHTQANYCMTSVYGQRPNRRAIILNLF